MLALDDEARARRGAGRRTRRAASAAHTRPSPSRAATAGAARRSRTAPASDRRRRGTIRRGRAPARGPARSAVPRDASDHRQKRRCRPCTDARRASRRTETADSTAAIRTRTPTSRRPSALPQRRGERRGQLLVGQRVTFGQRLDVYRAHAAFFEIAPGKRHRSSNVFGSADELRQRDVRFPPLRAARLAVRPALAEQRRARDRVARLAPVLLRALHGRAAGSRDAFAARRSGAARVRAALGRNSACRSFRKRRPSGVGPGLSGRARAGPCASPRRSRAATASGNPVRSAKSDAGTPSARRSAFSMNSNGKFVARDVRLFLQRRAARRLLEVLLRLLPAHLAHDAIGERQLRMRAGADAEVIAEAPVVDVVPAFGTRPSRAPMSRSAHSRPAPACRAPRPRCRPRLRRRATAADNGGRACSARASGDRTTGAAARTTAQSRRRGARRRASARAARTSGRDSRCRRSSAPTSAARRASSASCTRPSARRKRSSKLCTPSDSRFTPAAEEPGEFRALERAGIRFQRDLGIGRQAARARARRRAIARSTPPKKGSACRRR